jgi:AraC-like DNA-binding protein
MGMTSPDDRDDSWVCRMDVMLGIGTAFANTRSSKSLAYFYCGPCATRHFMRQLRPDPLDRGILLMNDVTSRQQRMTELLTQLAPAEGYTLCALEGVRLLRAHRPQVKTPALVEPSIGILLQGSKRIYFGGQTYVWDAQHYLVLSVPLPYTFESEASEQTPMLGIGLRADPLQIAELALALDEQQRRTDAAPKPLMCTALDQRLSDVLLRLLEALASPLEAKLLGPSILREIYLRVLTGDQGAALRAAVTQAGHFGKIAKALRHIHAEYHGDLDVDTLARDAAMSVAAFHAHFKAVTHTSPIQYIKATRLHKARLLMARDGVTAANAAAKVGYESPSQFSREFRRMFGRSPIDEARQVKNMIVDRPAANSA